MALGDDGNGGLLTSLRTHPWRWVALAAVSFVSDALLARAAIHCYFARRSASIEKFDTAAHETARREHQNRSNPAGFVALAPLANQLPLIERG